MLRSRALAKHRGLLKDTIRRTAITLLMVTVLTLSDAERFGDWQAPASAGLARAYGNGEPEYTPVDIKR